MTSKVVGCLVSNTPEAKQPDKGMVEAVFSSMPASCHFQMTHRP
ncbi:hypothetical protein PR003_g5709 [Phytophthora rubi]|uniref:Uncharacterized protein n=1 Tax=Phytophthora rubi TaxID=129364 RepID=A0A6A4FPD3_9STRA|nr:hypothetical protein PR003_g5709 [Phytophthora rubi]